MKILREPESTTESGSGDGREIVPEGRSMRVRPDSAMTDAKLSGFSEMHSRGNVNSVLPSNSSPKPWLAGSCDGALARATLAEPWVPEGESELQSASRCSPGTPPLTATGVSLQCLQLRRVLAYFSGLTNGLSNFVFFLTGLPLPGFFRGSGFGPPAGWGEVVSSTRPVSC